MNQVFNIKKIQKIFACKKKKEMKTFEIDI